MVWINQSIYFFFSVFHKLYFGIFQLVRNWKMSIWYLPLILRRNRMLNGSYSSCRPTTYECIQWKPVVSTSYLLSLVSYKIRWGGGSNKNNLNEEGLPVLEVNIWNLGFYLGLNTAGASRKYRTSPVLIANCEEICFLKSCNF